MSPSGKKTIPGQPTVEFQMNTRRRSSQPSPQATGSTSSDSSSSPIVTSKSTPTTPEHFSPRQYTTDQREMLPPKTPSPPSCATKLSVSPDRITVSAQLVTPDLIYPKSPLDSSPLSSPPASLGTTPEGLSEPITSRKHKAIPTSPTPRTRATSKATAGAVKNGSLGPDQRTDLKRKAGSEDDHVDEEDILPGRASKRVRTLLAWKSALNPKLPHSQEKERRVRFVSIQPLQNGLTLLADTALAGESNSTRRSLSEEAHAIIETLTSTQGFTKDPAAIAKPGRTPRLKRKTKDQLDLEVNVARHEEWIEATKFGHEDKLNPIFYAADGVTQYTGPAESSPSKNGKAAANTGSSVKKRRGGGGWNKGLGRGRGNGRGRGRGRGRGSRREEEEDPFEGKDSASDDHKALVKLLKARQAQLRIFFKDVGKQQADILDTLSLRDINKLVRRANAHKKVPEYEDIMEDLEERKEDAIDLSKRKLFLDTKLAQDQLAQEQEFVEQQYRQRFSQIRQEHLSGAQGDLMLLDIQKAAIVDDDRTDDGSHNQDSQYFPRHHEFPESNQRVRGYTSTRITDERPFKHQLAASSYDDQVRRDVLQSDIMEPVVRALEQSNKARREAGSREKTQNMMALSNEAIHQLSDIKGYLLPTRLTSTELNSYSLSLLADISEYHADRFKDKAYRYVPLPPGETFPKEALEFEQLPGTTGPPRRQHPPLPRFPNVPNPRTHQFVFQNPGVLPNTPPRPPQQSAPVQQRFAVQFVNQTIESRKAAGNGSGKGGQRMLLPKV